MSLFTKRCTYPSWAKRSGLLESDTAVSSPLLPRGRARMATVIQASATAGLSLLKNLQREAAGLVFSRRPPKFLGRGGRPAPPSPPPSQGAGAGFLFPKTVLLALP